MIHSPRTAGGDERNEQTLTELIDPGGQDQIPFVIDHQRGETLYESDPIIDYLGTHYK